MSEPILNPGSQVAGYTIERILGAGTIGEVYLARGAKGRAVAIKVLNPDVVQSGGAYVTRFLREARIAMRVHHPNLVAVHEVGFDETNRVHYLVMDYVQGVTLREALEKRGTFDCATALRIVTAVAHALSAGRVFNVVHRNLKPENIMLQDDGSVKLVDLGIAKAENLGETIKTSTDGLIGTIAYISPEQAVNPSTVDARADIYSLGIILFELVTGRAPYGGENPAKILVRILSDEPTPDPRQYDPSLSPSVVDLILAMSAKKLEHRIGSLDELVQRLQPPRWRWFALAAALIAAVGGALYAFLR